MTTFINNSGCKIHFDEEIELSEITGNAQHLISEGEKKRLFIELENSYKKYCELRALI